MVRNTLISGAKILQLSAFNLQLSPPLLQLTILPNFESWQKEARLALAAGSPPEDIVWEEWGSGQPELAIFEEPAVPPARGADALPTHRVPKAFLDVARTVACHRSAQRWALLYRVLWRLTHGEPRLLDILVDSDIYELNSMAKSIRHDIHKMRAFVRFREIRHPSAPDLACYVAWFEPEHHIVERNAKFFVDRFAAMNWSILTPDRCAHWDQKNLTLTDGVSKNEAPTSDTIEPLWLTYYAHIFNPARVKEAMMQSEMAKKYWKNLPEAALIPALLEEAPRRVETMHQESTRKIVPEEYHAAPVPSIADLPAVRAAALGCQACPIYRNATQTVFGTGPELPENVQIIFVGEQPGDQEDLAGVPFVGPAGLLFNRALEEIGLDRGQCYVTNAVKHFKWEPRGKRRIHAKPNAREIAACRPWVEAELRILQPKILVCLGATAAQSLLGPQVKITRDRGQWMSSQWAEKTLLTFHPSALLRAPDEATREQNYAFFKADLTLALEAMRENEK